MPRATWMPPISSSSVPSSISNSPSFSSAARLPSYRLSVAASRPELLTLRSFCISVRSPSDIRHTPCRPRLYKRHRFRSTPFRSLSSLHRRAPSPLLPSKEVYPSYSLHSLPPLLPRLRLSEIFRIVAYLVRYFIHFCGAKAPVFNEFILYTRNCVFDPFCRFFVFSGLCFRLFLSSSASQQSYRSVNQRFFCLYFHVPCFF